MLTAIQRKRLAREARKLAMECAEGTAPRFETHNFCGCAVGEVVKRAKVGGSRRQSRWVMARNVDRVLVDADASPYCCGIVSQALFDAGHSSLAPAQHTRLVFPLLALADALEATDG